MLESNSEDLQSFSNETFAATGTGSAAVLVLRLAEGPQRPFWRADPNRQPGLMEAARNLRKIHRT